MNTGAPTHDAESWISAAAGSGLTAAGSVRVLSRDDVMRCVSALDVTDVVRNTLQEHERGHCVLPSEAYLPWENAEGSYSRSIAMPGAVVPAEGTPCYGMKIINASVSNPEIGLERAGGIGLCFDAHTARITTIVEVGLLSALRTAGVTAVGVDALGHGGAESVGVIGCGMQARMHLFLLLEKFPAIRRITLFDRDDQAGERLAEYLRRFRPGVEVGVSGSAEGAAEDAGIVITVTTVNEGYLRPSAFAPGSLVVNVSLADLTDEALLAAGALYVDDVDLIAENPRRPLGRLLNEGRIGTPGGSGSGKCIDGTLGGLLTEQYGRVSATDSYTVLNPFGMSVLDVALLDAVRRQAVREGLGDEVWLG